MAVAAKAPSLLVCYGLQDYKLHDVVDESSVHGVSKRISAKSIPEDMQWGLSKIFCAHPHAIIKVTAEGKTLQGLAYDLVHEGTLTEEEFEKLVDLDKPYWTGEELQPYDFVPDNMMDIAMALSRLPNKSHAELVKFYEIEFCMGVIGYSPYTAIYYVVKDDEDELPEELAHLDGYVTPVRPVYEEDN